MALWIAQWFPWLMTGSAFLLVCGLLLLEATKLNRDVDRH